MTKHFALSIGVMATIIASPVDAERGRIFPSMNDRFYLEVRAKLITMGYRPVRARNRDTPDENCPGLSSCSAYPEIVYCSGTGLAFCESAFFNRKINRYIKIFTYGETNKRVYGIYYATDLDIRDWLYGTR